MAGTNNFLVWNPDKDNQLSDANWVSDSQRLGGAENPSIFTSQRANKLFYQLTMMVAGFGEMLKAKGYPVSDADAPALIDTLASILTVADLYSEDIGVANAFEVAIDSPVGMPLYFIAANDITGACTLTTTSVTTKPIKKMIDVALSEGDIRAGQMVGVVYDGTNFQMIGQGEDMKPPRAIYNNCITGVVPTMLISTAALWGGGLITLLSGALTQNVYKELLAFTGSGVLQFCGIKSRYVYPGLSGNMGIKIVIDGVTVIEVANSGEVSEGWGYAACGQLGNETGDGVSNIRLEAWPFRKSLSIQIKNSQAAVPADVSSVGYRLYLT